MDAFRKITNRVKSSKKKKNDLGLDDIFKPDWFTYEMITKFLYGVCQPHTIKNSEVKCVISQKYV